MNKKVLATAIAGALAAPGIAQAIDFKVSGHVNRMIRFVDDGPSSDVQQIDNTASRSRFRFIGSGDVGNGMKAGVRYEVGMASNRSGVITPKSGDAGDSFTPTSSDIRHSAIWFSGNWGKLTMGHTSEASDGTAFADNSGTFLADENSQWEHCSSCAFRTSGPAAASVSSLGAARSNFDGGRNDTFRYDSPALGPVTLAGSISNNDRWAFGAFVNTDLGGGNFNAAAGYTDLNGGSDQWTMSASYLFSQGTSITGGYGEADRVGVADSDNIFIKLGHKWGNNAVSVSWGESSDQAAGGVDSTGWGVGWQHTIAKPAIEIYAGYHNHDLDASATGLTNLGLAAGTGIEDVDMFVIGSRIRFR